MVDAATCVRERSRALLLDLHFLVRRTSRAAFRWLQKLLPLTTSVGPVAVGGGAVGEAMESKDRSTLLEQHVAGILQGLKWMC